MSFSLAMRLDVVSCFRSKSSSQNKLGELLEKSYTLARLVYGKHDLTNALTRLELQFLVRCNFGARPGLRFPHSDTEAQKEPVKMVPRDALGLFSLAHCWPLGGLGL